MAYKQVYKLCQLPYKNEMCLYSDRRGRANGCEGNHDRRRSRQVRTPVIINLK